MDNIPAISLVTSLYRTERHLPGYIRHAQVVWHALNEAGIPLEFVIVANDATPAERDLIDRLCASLPLVTVLHVDRETLYASWNRGVRAAKAGVIGFWNVDDVRTPEGLIEGYQRILQGCKLVYFSHRVIRTTGHRSTTRTYPAIPYVAEHHRQQMKCGPFFMFDRALYDEIGPFDERFRITGDFEWCSRATQYYDLCPVPVIGGTFYLHGGNLSDTGDVRQIAEANMVHLLRGTMQYLTPCPPDVMQATWEKWGDALAPLDEARRSQLWGAGAQESWQAWQDKNRRRARQERLNHTIRAVPRWLIDRLGLREALARVGIVRSRRKQAGES